MSLKVEGEFSVYVAGKVQQQIVAAMLEPGDIDIDLAEVDDIDTAGVQLLIAAKREAAAKGKKFQIQSHSPAVREVLDLYALTTEFGDPVLIPANAD